MNLDLDILRGLIKDEALVTAEENQYGKKFLELKEPMGRTSPGYKITILNTPEDIIAIKSDMFSIPIFKHTKKGAGKRADYIIVASNGQKNWIIFIEMKRGKHGQNNHIIKQLQGSKCFIDYCRSLGRTFWEEPKFLKEGEYQHRYVSVKNIGKSKRTSRETRNLSLHDCPENMLKINAPPKRGIQFNQLVRSAN